MNRNLARTNIGYGIGRTCSGLATILLLALGAAVGSAAPIINPVTTPVNHGTTLTITGRNFGSKATPAPQRWETWETGEAGQSPNAVSSYWNDGDNSSVSTGQNRHGYSTRSMKVEFPSSGGAYFFRNDSELDKYYVNFWVRWRWVDDESNVPTGAIQYQIKFFRFDNEVKVTWHMAPTLPAFAAYYPSSGGAFVYWQPKVEGASCTGMVTVDAGKTWTDNLPTYGDPRLPAWLNYVVLVDQTDIESVQFRIYASEPDFSAPYELDTKNGVSFANLCAGHEGERFRDIKFGGNVESGGPEWPVTLYYDDIYIDNTWARVEIGDKATYDACTRREVQIPVAWSSTSVRVTVNQGSFENGEAAYLYVSDAAGNLNAQGTPVVFGGASLPPRAPSPVRVQTVD